MYQKCPLCEGSGLNPLPGTYSTAAPICPTCNGHRIINADNGLPPKGSIGYQGDIDFNSATTDTTQMKDDDQVSYTLMGTNDYFDIYKNLNFSKPSDLSVWQDSGIKTGK